MATVGFERHDHARCIADTLAVAVAQCEKAGLQFTPVRRRVLEILLEQHRAMGAYDILEVLRQEGLGSQPPVAYRALDFLVSHGLAHRVERLNAFIACSSPEHQHIPTFLICRTCQSIAETPSDLPRNALAQVADVQGFAM